MSPRYRRPKGLSLRLGGVGIGLWCLAALGSSLLYYHAVLPLLLCFFLGRREGMIGSVVFLFGMTVMMMAPGLVGSHVYETGNSLRFLVAYLFLTLVGWSYERSRERVQGLLATKNGQLQLEKERLKDALVQVRTLRGLLPMCASCKRIRDDDGRWERIDTYVSQRPRHTLPTVSVQTARGHSTPTSLERFSPTRK